MIDQPDQIEQARPTSEERAELRRLLDADVIAAAINALPALLDAADERDQLAAAVERVQALADNLRSRGEYLAARSRAFPFPSEIADSLRDRGAAYIERARVIRRVLDGPEGEVAR